MSLVELTPLAGAMVGYPGGSGLTTEQRKRLTIGVELVANPSVIFMDEPTTGERVHAGMHALACCWLAVPGACTLGRCGRSGCGHGMMGSPPVQLHSVHQRLMQRC